MNQTIDSALSYYSAIGAALFPIPSGQKAPTGIVESFATDYSRDPDQWRLWASAHPNCNFGIVSGPSRIVIADIDVSELGKNRAWELWCDWWQSRGLAVPDPHVQSARGGWHCMFALPADLDIATLRQVVLVGPTDGSKKAIVDLRVGNGYTVAAGSYYDGTAKGEQSGHYTLISDSSPHPAPAALLEHCTRRNKAASGAAVGSLDAAQVTTLIDWLNERGVFAEYSEWVSVGMVCKLEFGDAGYDVWARTFDNKPETLRDAPGKWESFATEPTAGSQTINSLLATAHRMGWRGKIAKSTASMFGQVAQIAAAAGASLAVPMTGVPLPSNGEALPMIGREEKLTDICEASLRYFLDGSNEFPSRPATSDYPQIPDNCQVAALGDLLRAAIDRTVAMAECSKGWKAARFTPAMATLFIVHKDTFDSLNRRIESFGVKFDMPGIRLEAANILDRVERGFIQHIDWICDFKGKIESDNSDNVVVFLRRVRCEVRWNGWIERAQIRCESGEFSADWQEWTNIDDAVVAKLRTRGNRQGTRFLPGKDFFWESLIAIAHASSHDPALDHLAACESEWDGLARLNVWLTVACGVDCGLYHQAVGRNIIGGIVRRVRNPGCKHDTMPVFFGPQGTGKSTMAAILADMGGAAGTGTWFTDSVLLGDASKELVLALAGKTVAEIGEMGMRGSVDASHVKAMISKQVDAGRTAYARSVSERPRRNIFIGTTNDDEPLSDLTGNRRFLPVEVKKEIHLEWLKQNARQLFAEAATLESAGHDFSLPRAVWAIAAEHQEAAKAESDVEIQLQDWFSKKKLAAGTTIYVTGADLARLAHMMQWRQNNNARSQIMKRLGFTKTRGSIGEKREHLWIRGDSPWQSSARYEVGKHPTTGEPRVIPQFPSQRIPPVPG